MRHWYEYESDYWGRTDRMLREGRQPCCGYCGNPMSPEDDHGRFTCFCAGYTRANYHGLRIPQVTGDLPDEEKAKIPPINRLYLPPTQAEQKHLDDLLNDLLRSMREEPGE